MALIFSIKSAIIGSRAANAAARKPSAKAGVRRAELQLVQ